jgi:hypothetical protein
MCVDDDTDGAEENSRPDGDGSVGGHGDNVPREHGLKACVHGCNYKGKYRGRVFNGLRGKMWEGGRQGEWVGWWEEGRGKGRERERERKRERERERI